MSEPERFSERRVLHALLAVRIGAMDDIVRLYDRGDEDSPEFLNSIETIFLCSHVLWFSGLVVLWRCS